MIYLLYPIIGGKNKVNTILKSISLFLAENSIQCQLSGFSPDNETDLPNTKNAVVYLHVGDITILEKLNDFLEKLKAQRATVLVGGHFCISIKAIDILKRYENIDIVIRDPSAELALLHTVIALSENSSLKNIKGITFRERNNNNMIIHTKRDEMPSNIDHLQSPREKESDREKMQAIIVSIGCHNDCQYCIGHAPYKNDLVNPDDFWRKKTESKIVDEIQFFLQQGVYSFQFYCSEFLGTANENKQFVSNLINEILKRNLKIRYRFTAKPRNIKKNFDIFPLMIKSGLQEVYIGIDSGLERFHSMYKTSSNVGDCIAALDFFHKNRITFDVTYVFYDPFLTVKEIKENLRFLREIYPFFSDLPFPYSRYLDLRILNSALILRHGMPIINELKKFDLIIDSPGFPAHPTYRFLNNDVMIVYSAYSYVNKLVLPKIRHFFYDRELVSSFHIVELFPIMVMENIINWIEKEKTDDLRKIVSLSESFTKEVFGAIIGNIFEAFPKYLDTGLIEWLRK